MFPPDLIDLAAAGPVVIVGSADASGVPELSRAWGVHLHADRDEVVLCVSSSSARRVLANLEGTGRIAVTITSPLTYRSFQMKGRVTSMAPASSADLTRVTAHQEAFVETVVTIGLPRELTPRLFTAELEVDASLTTVRMAVEALFDQTPGPGAGARL